MMQSKSAGHAVRSILAWVCMLGMGSPAQALDLEFFDGDVYVNVSHNLTYGVNVSAEEVNSQVIYAGANRPRASGANQGCEPAERAPRSATSCGNGGKNSGPNDDISHYAFKQGVIANQFKGTTDVRATWGEFTAFTRLLYFYDWEIMNQSREKHLSTHYEEVVGTSKTAYGFKQRPEFSGEAEEEIGADFRYLDLYVSWETFIGDSPLTLRVGNQVINWGQSTFLPGIGITNPVDLNRLFAPGFELQELFKPVPLAFASFGITENISVEAYYQFEWEPVVLPPGGSFFAVNNYTGAGETGSGLGTVCLDGTATNLGFADDANNNGIDDGIEANNGGLGGICVNTSNTLEPSNGNEFGVRLGITLPWLNYTQLDFYAIRYHSRLPHVGAITTGILPNGGDALCAAANNATLDPLSPLFGLALANCASAESRSGEFPTVQLKYLPDLWAYGFSFSGNIPGGWTMQGEISYKKDMPMQPSLPELIGAAAWLSFETPAGGGATVNCSVRQINETATCGNGGADGPALDLAALGLLAPGDIGTGLGLSCDPAKGERCDPNCATYDPTLTNCAYDRHRGGVPSVVAKDGAAQGFVELDFLQAQVTFLKLFPQMFGGDTLLFVAEIIGAKVLDMPGPSELMFEKSDFSDFSNAKRSKAEDFGWAYRLLIRNEYTNLFGTSWGVSPTFVWFHDVNGSPPANSGTFLEDRKQAILVLPFNYQNKYTISFKYAWFGGAPQSNVFQDRDSWGVTFSAAM